MNKRNNSKNEKLIPIERIEQKIFFIRGMKVMIDRDLAELYRVETKQLKRAVNRNIERFPKDFMFALTNDELKTLRCQIGTSKKGRGGDRYLPYAFTQEGVAMLSSVLKSSRAIQVNIQIMRAFIKLRTLLASHPTREEFESFKQELLNKIEKTEKKYDAQFKAVFQAIKQLLKSPEKPKRKIGF